MRRYTHSSHTSPKNKSLARLAAMLALSLAPLGQPAQADVVYSYTDVNQGLQINGNAFSHLGDDVTLAGTNRKITSATVGTIYFFDANHTAYTPNLTLTLYDSTTPGTDGTGHVIVSSTATGVAYQSLPTFSCGGGSFTCSEQMITFLFPALTVPNSFFLGVSQNGSPGTAGDAFSLEYDNTGAVVGSTAATEFYRYPPGDLNFHTNFGDFPVVNNSCCAEGDANGLRVTIQAIPEPASIALLGLGLAALGLYRRKKT